MLAAVRRGFVALIGVWEGFLPAFAASPVVQLGWNLLLIAILYKLFAWLLASLAASKKRRHWRKVAHNKRRERNHKRLDVNRVECTVPLETQNAILSIRSSRLLRDAMVRGRFSTADVVSTYAARCSTVGASLNLNAEECFAEALEAAKEVDAGRTNPEGLLRGVPISVKDQYLQRGFDSTCGTACKAFKPAPADGLLVELLRDAGAIPVVRSNVPQCLMLPESDNLIWGRAKNPWDKGRTPGGSSGGEGGLIAAQCSPLGIGTDIGGSIRIPAHYCGVYGFKPTPERLTKAGLEAPRPRRGTGQEGIRSAAGPMGKSVDDLVLVMRAWWVEKMFKFDVTIPPLPFNMDTYGSRRKLRIGYFEHDDFFHACPTAVRAVQETVEALRRRDDVELVPFQPHDITEMIRLYYSIMGAEGKMRGFISGLEGEELHPLYKKLYTLAQLPRWLRPIISQLLAMLGQHRVAGLNKAAGEKTTAEYWAVLVDRTFYKRDFIRKWKAAGLDALLGPTLPLPAMRHGDSAEMTLSLTGTMVYNVLHFPAGVCPVTRVRSDECYYDAPKAQHDRFTARAKAIMKTAAGLPYTVQVATLPYQDETCLRVMQMIEQEVGYDVTAPDRR